MSKALKSLLTEFLTSTEEDVLLRFASLPKAHVAKGDRYVYVPGTRANRLLLVAHADTVGGIPLGFDVLWIGDVAVRKDGPYTSDDLKSYQHGVYTRHSLGADDRAGCAMLWHLQNSGHSLLVTTGEESGLKGAAAAASEIGEELKKHQFAVEVDRRGDRQMVFYDVGTPEFKAYMVQQLSKLDYDGAPWAIREGSCSDISHICGSIGICGVNLAAGYWNEHQETEFLMLGAWMHTRTALKRLLKLQDFPQFVLPKRKHVDYGARWDSWEKDKLSLPQGQLSKRQRKKLIRKTEQLVASGKVTKDQAAGFLKAMFSKYEVKDKKIITEEQRMAHWLGDSWVTPTPMCLVCGRLRGNEHAPHCSTRSQHAYVWPEDTTQTNRHSAKEIIESHGESAEDPSMPPSSGSSGLGAKPGVKTCKQCGTKFSQLRIICPKCSSCVTTSGASSLALVKADSADGIVLCYHYCTVCKHGWHHAKAKSGGCQLVHDVLCPLHSKDVAVVTERYEREACAVRRILRAGRTSDEGGGDIQEHLDLSGGAFEELKDLFRLGGTRSDDN